jgi:methyltransferase-like protein/SAM-dependent methyltransferase
MRTPGSLYDQVPYDGLPQPRSHPSALSAMARVFGLSSPPPENCRVLELGCGSAANLISIALTLPGSRCVGLDLSEKAIARGLERAAQVGLANLDLSVGSILEVSAALGRFDYILCHGVFSWVPQEEQDALLRICRDNLADNGIAFVSYNTYPGWHLRAVARDLMRYHVRDVLDPAERVAQARAILDLAARFAETPRPAYRGVLEEEAREIGTFEDWYLLHDSLADVNTPVHFQEFVERAAKAGLQYMASDRFPEWETRLPPDVAKALASVTGRVRREQYLDFLTNRTFRKSLLCRAGITLQAAPSAEAVPALFASADALPLAGAPGDPEESRKFTIRGGHELATDHPLLSAALDALSDAAPATLSFGQIAGRAAARVPGSGTPEELKRDLSAGLLLLFRANALDFWTRPFALPREPGDFPRASPLARLEARDRTVLTNLKHQLVQPDPTVRAVLGLCNGTRDRNALVTAVVAATASGELELKDPEGQAVHDAAKIREIASAAVPAALSSLSRLALLSE